MKMSQLIRCGDESAADKVFRLDELREEILKYVIYDNLGKLSGTMVGNVRVVQKSWLKTTTKLLRKSGEPVTEFSLDVNCSFSAYLNLKIVKVEKLVETFGASPRLKDSFLPLKLYLTPGVFRERHYQCVSDCLTRLGNDLVEIAVYYPRNGGTMPVTFPPFSLPKLWKLYFEFLTENLNKDESDDEDVFGNNQNGLGLLQTILFGSNAVKDLIIACFGDIEFPVGFKYLHLPLTISSFNINAKLKSKDFEVLLRNQLPNLSSLSLKKHDVPFQDGRLFKILERFQNSLQFLKIYGFTVHGFHLQFPPMAKLNEIYIDCTEYELDPRNVSDLQKFLPELTVVKLLCHSKGTLATWTKDSRFEKVMEVSVSIINGELNADEYYISPGPVTVIQLLQTFPNVRSLSLTINVYDLTGLKYVFQDMAQLNTLKICFSGERSVTDNSSDMIDSTFLGLSLKLVVGLKEDIHLLDAGKIIIKDCGEPSIRNLSELSALTLGTCWFFFLEENGVSLISNLLFRQAFMKMPKLRKLDLHNKFKPTSEMEEEWNGHGRSMKYSRSRNIDVAFE